MLLLAFGAWNCKAVGETGIGWPLFLCKYSSAERVYVCVHAHTHTCGFQAQLTGWVLAADYRMLDCILIVSPLEKEDE